MKETFFAFLLNAFLSMVIGWIVGFVRISLQDFSMLMFYQLMGSGFLGLVIGTLSRIVFTWMYDLRQNLWLSMGSVTVIIMGLSSLPYVELWPFKELSVWISYFSVILTSLSLGLGLSYLSYRDSMLYNDHLKLKQNLLKELERPNELN